MIKEYINLIIFEIIVLIIAAVCWIVLKNLWFLLVSLFIFFALIMTVYFYRDPERSIPTRSGIVLSPADGVVTDITTQKEENFCQKNITLISIFLRLWDVHINRMPVDGRIKYINYKKGRFHPVFFKKSAEVNEQMLIGVENGQGRFLIRQVAGMLARRIVCTVQPEDHVHKGQKFGMIKMGSLVELAMPVKYKITIKKGQRIKAGETVIGILESEK